MFFLTEKNTEMFQAKSSHEVRHKHVEIMRSNATPEKSEDNKHDENVRTRDKILDGHYYRLFL